MWGIQNLICNQMKKIVKNIALNLEFSEKNPLWVSKFITNSFVEKKLSIQIQNPQVSLVQGMKLLFEISNNDCCATMNELKWLYFFNMF